MAAPEMRAGACEPSAARLKLHQVCAAPAMRQRLLGGGQVLFDLGSRDGAGHTNIVGEDHGGGAGDLVLAAESQIALDGGRVTLGGSGILAVQHLILPGLGLILGAPDIARLFGRVRAQDGVEEEVDGDVVHALQVFLKALAVAAVRVFKHGHLALALAMHDGDGVLDGQLLEVHGRELGHAIFGQVAARLGVDQLALNQIVALGIGVENVRAHADLVQAAHGGGAHLVDFFELGNALGQRLLEVGVLGVHAQAEGQAGGGQQAGSKFHGRCRALQCAAAWKE
ncbi:hypothetical protein SDC9_108669 [bioreactor metagenome]|uniref:NAD-specific glutamate dehydrogenase n=1 Tax=bioreactor metagenome TaxID=1076179 RepID=A0A645B9T1_9ZZZZ